MEAKHPTLTNTNPHIEVESDEIHRKLSEVDPFCMMYWALIRNKTLEPIVSRRDPALINEIDIGITHMCLNIHDQKSNCKSM